MKNLIKDAQIVRMESESVIKTLRGEILAAFRKCDNDESYTLGTMANEGYIVASFGGTLELSEREFSELFDLARRYWFGFIK